MADEIKPALTAAEWEERTLRSAYGGTAQLWIRDGRVCVDNSGEEYAPGELSPHAVAALALYGQPFGFTHDDVVRLRDVASTIDAHGDAIGPEWVNEVLKPLRALADRIAALLPPE